jgi:hypothetical protein
VSYWLSAVLNNSCLLSKLKPALRVPRVVPSYPIEYSHQSPSLLLTSEASGLLSLLSHRDDGKVFEFKALDVRQ